MKNKYLKYSQLSPEEKKKVAAENKEIGLNFSLKKIIRDCKFSFDEDGNIIKFLDTNAWSDLK